MSDDLTFEELLLLTYNRMAWKNYTGLKERAYQQAKEKEMKSKK